MEYSMGTVEYHIYYGCGYYANQNYQTAANNFELGVRQFPNSAALYYHLGSAYAAFASMNKSAEDSEPLVEKAVAAFEKALKLDASLKEKIKNILVALDGEEEPNEEKPKAETSGESEMKIPRIGDEVEVEATSENWVRGKVTRIVGGLPCPALEVEHDAYGKGDLRKLVFFCKSFRPVTTKSSAAKNTERAVGGALDFGDYVCTEQQGRTTKQKGYFKLNSNGTYRYLDGGTTGRYKYNAETGEITWLSGYFTDGNRTTAKFTPGKNVSQIDIAFQTASGDLNWSCGHNK